MAPSRIFYNYSNRLYGSRARAGLLILSKKVPPQTAKFISSTIAWENMSMKMRHAIPIKTYVR